MGGIYAYGINSPRFFNGTPFVMVGDVDGNTFADDGNGSQNTTDDSGNSLTNGSFYYDSVSCWTGYMYGNNWRHFHTGANYKYIDFAY